MPYCSLDKKGRVQMKLNFDKEQITEVIDRIAERTMKMDLAWDWPCG